MNKKNEERLFKYKQYLRREYPHRGTKVGHTQKNYYRFTKDFLKWIEENKDKTYKELTFKDLQDYQLYCLEKFKQNGNVGRLSAVNNFTVKFLGRKKLKIPVPNSVFVNKPILSKEELKKYVESTETPLEKLIAIYQVDGHLRPEDFYRLKISWHDCKNQILYTNESKSGDTSVILTPHMEKAFKEYLSHRVTPKRKGDEDKLIITPKGSHYGLAPSPGSDFIYRHTKRIAVKAGINRSVYPYLIKPSAITDKFNDGVPPKIIQRQSRHKRIEYTLRYDQTDDKMVKEYFNRVQTLDTKNLTPEDKAKVWFDKLLSNEIDLKTFKTGMDFLLPDIGKSKQRGEDIGYM